VSRPVLVVLRALGMGDLLTAVPALRALKRHFPRHRRVLLAPRWLEPLARQIDPTHEFRAHPGLVPLPADLAAADVAVDLHGRGPCSQPILLAARPRRLLCFSHPALPETWHGAAFRRDEHEVSRWCRLLEHFGIPASTDDLYVDLPPIPPPLLDATVLHPGAASGARRWPLERFVAVGRHEQARGRQVVVTGACTERHLVDRLGDALGIAPPRRFIGRPLLELAALIGDSGRVVVGDTGVAHLATALGTPSVVICGPVGPHLWGPPAGDRRHVALWAGRSGNPHGAAVDPGLLRITAGAVIAAIDELEAPVRDTGRRLGAEREPQTTGG
jgi:ADP-heptose:LPS heptosyltransferase